ncbi:MAG: AAA family ATPase, partial [Gemmatimonadaceae bacterium]
MIRILSMGKCAIELDGSQLSAESEVVFGLLLYLAARAGDTVSREDAQALLWPELSRERGRHCLRQSLYRLRQLGVPLQGDNGALGISLGDVTSDFGPFVADDAPAASYRDAAIGDILPGYFPMFSQPFAAWVEEYRAQIGLRIRKQLVRTILDLRSKGRYREAEPLARVCLASDPFNEVATLALAEARVVLGGNRAEALAILDRYVEEVGGSRDQRLALSATVLRRRISERFVEQRYAAPPEAPFVGREDVLQLMVEKMQEAVAGRSTIVYVWGEPGIGKTRLLDELTKVALVQGVRVERYTVTPNDPERPLAMFSSLLPRLTALPGAVGISPESYEAIQRFIDPTAWERVDPPASVAEAARVFGRLRTGIAELVEVLAEERPFVLLVDDVHWSDARSIEVLSEVVERVRGRRVVFVLTSREQCTGTGTGGLEALCARAAVRRLDGLRASEVERLLRQIADQRDFELTPAFVRRTLDA